MRSHGFGLVLALVPSVVTAQDAAAPPPPVPSAQIPVAASTAPPAPVTFQLVPTPAAPAAPAPAPQTVTIHLVTSTAAAPVPAPPAAPAAVTPPALAQLVYPGPIRRTIGSIGEMAARQKQPWMRLPAAQASVMTVPVQVMVPTAAAATTIPLPAVMPSAQSPVRGGFLSHFRR